MAYPKLNAFENHRSPVVSSYCWPNRPRRMQQPTFTQPKPWAI